jgi:hypothetical protein
MAEASATPIIETAPEKWRPIPGYEPHYEVSNHGRLRSMTYRKHSHVGYWPEPRPLRSQICPKTGYWKVKLRGDGHNFNGAVHTLVALAFLGPKPTPKHEVGHLDGVRTNPVLSNPAYVTKAENEAHKKVHARPKPRPSLLLLPRAQINEMRAVRARFGSAIPLSVFGRMFGVSTKVVTTVCTATEQELSYLPQADGATTPPATTPS